MSNWQDEYRAECQRQQTLKEIQQIRLEKIASQVRVYRSGLFARTMFNFANWMIFAGKNLRKRYEIPNVDCSKTTTESFAH